MNNHFPQGRAVRSAQSVHTAQVAGSNPAPATNIEIIRTTVRAGQISIIAYRNGERIGTAEYAPGDACGTWYVRAAGAETRYRHDRTKTAEENLCAVELLIALQISAADASLVALATSLVRPEYA